MLASCAGYVTPKHELTIYTHHVDLTRQELKDIDSMLDALMEEFSAQTGVPSEVLVGTLHTRPPLVILSADRVPCGDRDGSARMRTGCFSSPWEVDRESTIQSTWNFPQCRALGSLMHEFNHYFLWQTTLSPDHTHQEPVWDGPNEVLKNARWTAAQTICKGYLDSLKSEVTGATMLLE